MTKCLEQGVKQDSHHHRTELSPEEKDPFANLSEKLKIIDAANLGWKIMICSHCEGLGQQESWLLIGYTV